MKPIPRSEVSQRLYELRFTRYLTSSMLPKREFKYCKWCGKPSKWTWCSDECKDEAYVRMGFSDSYVRKRDKGICAKCGMDCTWLKKQLTILKQMQFRHRVSTRKELKEAFGPWWSSYNRLWQADHIVPVCEGGGCCGLENYQTLCLRCHKEDTKEIHKRKSKRNLEI